MTVLIQQRPLFPLLLMQKKTRITLSLLGILLVTIAVLSVSTGAMAIRPAQELAIIAGGFGVSLPWAYEQQQQIVVMDFRLPRIILGMLVGAALAVSGAALQGLFRNPLADPALIGVSSGAALAAVAYIVMGEVISQHFPAVLRPYLFQLCAFLGGLLTVWMVFRIGTVNGRTVVATMLLAGIAIGTVASALTGLLIFLSNDQQLRDLTFWSLGSLSRSSWENTGPGIILLSIPIIGLASLGRPLNAYALGESEAGHLGFDTQRLKRIIIVLTALAVGVAVALSGVIGFIGLVVPHLIRLLIGPDHRILFPAAILCGAILLLVADMLARTIIAPAELPIGIITSGLGAPFFLWLLLNKRNVAGG